MDAIRKDMSDLESRISAAGPLQQGAMIAEWQAALMRMQAAALSPMLSAVPGDVAEGASEPDDDLFENFPV